MHGLINRENGSMKRGIKRPLSFHLNWLMVVLAIIGSAGGELSAKRRAVIDFNLKYGFIKGGTARIIIADTLYKGRPAVYYYLEGRTTGVTDALFKVHNVYESIVDANTHLPIKAVRNVKERSYRYFNEVTFFQEQDSIYSARTGGIKVPNNLTDISSVFFYFVHQNYIATLQRGKTLSFPVIDGHVVGEIKIGAGEIKPVETDLGTIDCYLLKPELEKGKVLARSDGINLYITQKDKIPVMVDVDLKVGTLRAVLAGYSINGKEITQL